MSLEQYNVLHPRHVALGIACPDREALLYQIADLAATSLDVSRESIAAALAWRESLGTTAAGGSLALPHAQVGRLCGPIALFLRLSTPLPFNAEDRAPIDMVFSVLYPKHRQDEAFSLLRHGARLLMQHETRRAIRDTGFPDEVASLFCYRASMA